MRVSRGLLGALPYAAIGAGPPAIVLAGLSPTVGVKGEWFVRGTLAPFSALAETHRVHLLNRRAHLPQGMTLAELAAEHADAFTAEFGRPVDVIGISTGGSIAQQLAADRPEVVRRLVLISTGCRLDPATRDEQARVATHVRAGNLRAASREMFAALPAARVAQSVTGGTGWLVGPALIRDRQEWLDLATTIEAEDAFDLRRCAAPIQSPTLIVAGARDRFYPPALFQETADVIPDSTLLTVPGRGHVTVAGDRRTRAALLTFLRPTALELC